MPRVLEYGNPTEVPQPDTIRDRLERLGRAVEETKWALEGIEGRLFGLNQVCEGQSNPTPHDIESIIQYITNLAEDAQRTALSVRDKL